MARDITVIIMACLLRCRRTGQAPERPRHIRGPLPLLRSRPGGVCSLAIARRPEPDKIADYRFAIADEEPVFALQIGNWQSEIENLMAERVGFEPTVQFPVHSISSAASSATPAPLQKNCRLLIADFRLNAGVRVTDQGRKRQSKIGNRKSTIGNYLAERVGFEPTEPLRVQRFSRPPDSTTLAPLRMLLGVTSVAKKRL